MRFKDPDEIETTTKNISGFNLVIRDLFDEAHKVYWDEKIAKEMINEDCYQLRQLKLEDSGISSIIDIGAHIGSFAVISNVYWPNAEIKSFEPLPVNFKLLSINTEHIRNKVSVINAAVAGIKAKEVRLLSPSCNHKENKKLNTGDAKLDSGGDLVVETMTLSEIMASKPCSLLKMDCEESELEILAEASRKRCLGQIKHIRMEVHSEPYFAAITELLKPTHNVAVISRICQELFVAKADLK